MTDEAHIVDLELELSIAQLGVDGEESGQNFVAEAVQLAWKRGDIRLICGYRKEV